MTDQYGLQPRSEPRDLKSSSSEPKVGPGTERLHQTIQECLEALHRASALADRQWRNKGCKLNQLRVAGSEITITDGLRSFKFQTQRPKVYQAIDRWSQARPFPNDNYLATRELTPTQLNEIAAVLAKILKEQK